MRASESEMMREGYLKDGNGGYTRKIGGVEEVKGVTMGGIDEILGEQEFHSMLSQASTAANRIIANFFVTLKGKIRTLQQDLHDALAINEELRGALSDLKAENELLLRDDLTGVYARKGGFLAFNRTLERLKKESISIHLAFIDLNHFKPINDTYGHAVGDRVLASFGEQIQSFETSLEGKKNTGLIRFLPIRTGGDEFMLITFVKKGNPQWKELISDGISRHLSHFTFNNTGLPALSLQISASYGMISSEDIEKTHPGRNMDLTVLMHEADMAMYGHKKTVREGEIGDRRDLPRMPNER